MSLCCLRNVNFAFKNIIIKGNLDLLRAGFYMSKNNSYQTSLCCLDSFWKKDQINEKKNQQLIQQWPTVYYANVYFLNKN